MPKKSAQPSFVVSIVPASKPTWKRTAPATVELVEAVDYFFDISSMAQQNTWTAIHFSLTIDMLNRGKTRKKRIPYSTSWRVWHVQMSGDLQHPWWFHTWASKMREFWNDNMQRWAAGFALKDNLTHCCSLPTNLDSYLFADLLRQSEASWRAFFSQSYFPKPRDVLPLCLWLRGAKSVQIAAQWHWRHPVLGRSPMRDVMCSRLSLVTKCHWFANVCAIAKFGT